MASTMSRENNETASIPYDHTEATSTIEDINKQLNDLKDSLSKKIVKCHLLQVDLATQFNPHMVQSLKKTESDCDRCTKKLELVFAKPVLHQC